MTQVGWLVGWLIILLPGVGWDIMRHESDPLPFYPDLRNCSYSFKLITTPPHLFLHVMYRILIPPAHHPACPQHTYTYWHATVYAMVVCRLLMYTPMGWSPVDSITSSIAGYSHSLPTPRFAVIPVIRRAA